MNERARCAIENVRVDVHVNSTGVPLAASTERLEVEVGVNVLGNIDTDAPELTRKFTGACVVKVACMVNMAFGKIVEIVIVEVVEVGFGVFRLVKLVECTLFKITAHSEVAL